MRLERGVFPGLDHRHIWMHLERKRALELSL